MAQRRGCTGAYLLYDMCSLNLVTCPTYIFTKPYYAYYTNILLYPLYLLYLVYSLHHSTQYLLYLPASLNFLCCLLCHLQCLL